LLGFLPSSADAFGDIRSRNLPIRVVIRSTARRFLGEILCEDLA
jgi:hypothetical protein